MVEVCVILRGFEGTDEVANFLKKHFPPAFI